MTRRETHIRYSVILKEAARLGFLTDAMRDLCKKDLFYLLVYALHRPDADNDWVFDRCREVQKNPDGYLDLWAREHYKSTIITFALNIQNIINDPEVTIGIFSFNRPIAKAFLRQIKRELESNERLKTLFPDVLYTNPQKESPKWSEDEGIVVKRQGNPKESTVEAWGLVDGQPTSKHFRVLNFDDVVTKDSVTTPEMISKVTEAMSLSFNLGAEGGVKRFAGTRYSYNDTYSEMIRRGTVTLRKYAATKDGTLEGEPWLWSRETLAQKIRDMGPYVAACQLFNEPSLDSAQGFKESWLRFWPASDTRNLNLYLLCDPAGEKKKENDYTVFMVIGLGADRNYYIVRMIRDRLNLTERANALFALHQQYRPVAVGYERYGMMADVQYIQERMNQTNYRFALIELGGITPKLDRIRRLIPYFEQGRVFLPDSSPYTNYEGVTQDLTRVFRDEEYKAFPVSVHDDMLDCLARILDPAFGAAFPQGPAAPIPEAPTSAYDYLRSGL